MASTRSSSRCRSSSSMSAKEAARGRTSSSRLHCAADGACAGCAMAAALLSSRKAAMRAPGRSCPSAASSAALDCSMPSRHGRVQRRGATAARGGRRAASLHLAAVTCTCTSGGRWVGRPAPLLVLRVCSPAGPRPLTLGGARQHARSRTRAPAPRSAHTPGVRRTAVLSSPPSYSPYTMLALHRVARAHTRGS